MSIAGKWGYSHDEETYFGTFDTKKEAIRAGRQEGRPLWVGQYIDPISPEKYIDGKDLIEQVLCQNDYCGEWAEGALDCTGTQLAELTMKMRSVFGDWLDKHDLRPRFGLVDNAKRILAR